MVHWLRRAPVAYRHRRRSSIDADPIERRALPATTSTAMLPYPYDSLLDFVALNHANLNILLIQVYRIKNHVT